MRTGSALPRRRYGAARVLRAALLSASLFGAAAQAQPVGLIPANEALTSSVKIRDYFAVAQGDLARAQAYFQAEAEELERVAARLHGLIGKDETTGQWAGFGPKITASDVADVDNALNIVREQRSNADDLLKVVTDRFAMPQTESYHMQQIDTFEINLHRAALFAIRLVWRAHARETSLKTAVLSAEINNTNAAARKRIEAELRPNRTYDPCPPYLAAQRSQFADVPRQLQALAAELIEIRDHLTKDVDRWRAFMPRDATSTVLFSGLDDVDLSYNAPGQGAHGASGVFVGAVCDGAMEPLPADLADHASSPVGASFVACSSN
jgi:hypothetical protein